MKVPIEATIAPEIWKEGGATATLRVENLKGFTSSLGQFVPPSNGNAFYLEIPITITGDIPVIPGFEIDSTDDCLPWDSDVVGDVPGYRFTIVTSKNKIIPYFARCRVPTLADGDPSITWAELRILNRARARKVIPQRFIPESTINGLIQTAAGDLNKASSTNTGVTALTVDPVDPGFPIGVGANDPAYLNLLNQQSVSDFIRPEDFGAAGDGVTDDTIAIQAAIQAVIDAGGGSILLDQKTYVIAGPLTDTGASNAQLVLPKVNNNEKMIAIAFVGVTPPPNPWSTDGGSILRSTLATGNGCVIGVKNDQGNGSASANIAAHNLSSYINVVFENITVRLPANPTNSAIDLSCTYNPVLTNLRVDTADFGTGGLNPNLVNGVPDVLCTEPTTASSWGVKLPMDFVPSNCRINNLTILGYYNALRIGELVHGRGITIGGCKVGIGIEGATWPSHLEDVVIVSTTRKVKALGVNPDLNGISGANTNAIIYIDQLKVEDDPLMAWAMTVYDIDDPDNLLTGRINVFGGQAFSQSQPRLNQGANPNLHIGNLALWNGMRVDQWKTYTPTLAANTGSLTSATATGRWRQIDVTTVAVEIFIQITTNGTAAGYVTATLPVTAPNDWAQAFSGRAGAGATFNLGVLALENTNVVVITKYDGSYPGGDGVNFHISCIVRLTP